MPRVAITGTPGCGKTTLCGLLRAQGHNVVDVIELARSIDAVAGHDADDDADVVDIDAMESMELPDGIYVDGHLSHLLDVDEIWVIRADPSAIRDRLTQRGYHAGKIQENWEAECMDLILQESIAHGARVVQRDGSRRTPAELLSAFQKAGPAPSNNHDIEPVDWSERLLD